jgi:hypothetical protein
VKGSSSSSRVEETARDDECKCVRWSFVLCYWLMVMPTNACIYPSMFEGLQKVPH